MEKSYREQIAAFAPSNEQEAGDQAALLWYIERFGDDVLQRENVIAHITSSGFIMNPALDKALMIHHNIRDTWAWTGGHADGNGSLLSVAIQEAREETGVSRIEPLCDSIASIDILCAGRHIKNGRYVSTHLHLSVAYILLCDEAQALRIKPDENSAVAWFPVSNIAQPLFNDRDVYLYTKLIRWAHRDKTS